MADFCLIMIGFFIFINLLFLVPLAAGAPHVIFLVVRVFFGVLIALYHQIVKGFTLYDDLTEEQKEEGEDFAILHYMRIISLFVLCAFTVYLTISAVCLCIIGGLDGNNIRRRGNGRRFKRIPFGQLLFAEGLDCAICMDRFLEDEKVVQLACHETHVYHKTCLK